MNCRRYYSLGLTTLTLFHTASLWACSCASYYPERQAPEWVTHQSVTDDSIFSVGATQCTGLKSLDEKRADQEARVNLTKVLESRVTSQEQVTLSSHDGVSNAGFRSQTTLFSEQWLRHAIIYDRWADTENCVIYAAISISQQQIRQAQQEQQALHQRQLIAQPMCVTVSGDAAKSLRQAIESALVQEGYSLISQPSCRVQLKAKNRILVERSNQVQTRLDVEILGSEHHVIWKKQYGGKGISFSSNTKAELFERAQDDSISSLAHDLQKLKFSEVN